MEQITLSHTQGTEMRDGWVSRDERGTHEGQTEKGDIEPKQQSKPKPTRAFWGAAEAARKRGGSRRPMTFGAREHAAVGGTGTTRHTQTDTATLGSLHNVNGGRLYPTLFPSCIWEVNTRV